MFKPNSLIGFLLSKNQLFRTDQLVFGLVFKNVKNFYHQFFCVFELPLWIYYYFDILIFFSNIIQRGVPTCVTGAQPLGKSGGPCSPPSTSIFEPEKVQQFQFQTSEVSNQSFKLHGPEISRFSPCMLQFLDNIQQLLIFSNYTRETDHFSLDFLKPFLDHLKDDKS